MLPPSHNDGNRFSDPFGFDSCDCGDFGDWDPDPQDLLVFGQSQDKPQQLRRPLDSVPELIKGTGTSASASASISISAPAPTPTGAVASGPVAITAHDIAKMRKVGGRLGNRGGRLPEEATHEMKLWILANRSNPFPRYEQKNRWMTRFNLTMDQINNFMANNRARLLGRLKDRTLKFIQVIPGAISCVPVWVTLGTAPLAPQFNA
jgi:hypothetical protein